MAGDHCIANRPLKRFVFRGKVIELGAQTKLMGVLNVTPDSFSDGGAYLPVERACERALQMQGEGAHLIDLGGESTRPGARPVSAAEELRRIKPVLIRLKRVLQIPISVDTYKAEVAEVALAEGADVINDIRALRCADGKPNKRLARAIARTRAGLILMHMQGDPRTMQKKPKYQDPVGDIKDFLKASVRTAMEAGISRESLVLDPGFGFGKTPEHNLEILGRMKEFQVLRLPLLAGLSRKSFLGVLSGEPVDRRLPASLAAAAAAVYGGAHILRVHDVAAHRQFFEVVDRCLKG